MVVYLDLLFLFNFAVDGALLLTTAWVSHTKVRAWRVAASAAIGALYVIFMLYPQLSFLFTLGIKFIFSVLMIGTAFGFRPVKRFWRHMGAFYLVNFAAAGSVIGVYYFFLSSSELMDGFLFSMMGVPGTTLIVVTLPLLVWLYLKVFHTARRQTEMLSYMAEVEVCIDDFHYQCTGLIDTGNHLYDPLTKTPVMIMEAGQWKEVLPETWMKRIRQAEVDQIVAALGTEEFAWQDRLRLVPYRGVNRGTQFMLAIKPDRVTVRYNEKRVETQKVLVGLDGGQLSSDGAYQAILHPTLLEA
ncbi:sigma-E processing peptidase SpoIIGA [Paenibacillus aurantius]|uniref:Sporulation sigma-E factor-processing peptidase n=1 Tax=Paenibacillus aurantius TaxID=2918900 RepID=A0AA96LHP9_9BACL|nr:sigma-E processing peptidase SpoIIGA [Paenibacillus aurantius]WJH33091.1 sigma-E processing peptidase SpoIIGA [Paenibacillus sp. CC-CFT747]WNQ13523.1 sigma-E processing peptidase SpoIIGA [Paenibacillus aurantius]